MKEKNRTIDNNTLITKEMKKSYDVVVVGSGPAGASAAKTLIGSGLDVVIIEKCSLPRDKMCGGIILPSARKFLSENYDDIPKQLFTEPKEIKGSRYMSTCDPQAQVIDCPGLDLGDTLPNREFGLSIDRVGFDFWLCKESRALMADNCLLIDYKKDGRDISVRVKHDGNYMRIKTKYLIGADGPISRVRRSLFPEFDKTLNWVALYEEHYEGKIDLDPEWMYWIIDPISFGSLIHKGGNIHLNVSNSKEETAINALKRFVSFLKNNHGLKIGKKIMSRGIVMNDMPYRENYLLGKENVLLVGESAGFVRALDGITGALVSGKAAGEAILQSIKSGRPPMEHYSEHELVHSEWAICKKVQPNLANYGFSFGK
ncbi:putative FAD binding domain protein [Desulfosarcina cetonica]|uniref:NAD(P)/FAD-dependent oxidoreductase n=1 Tax=Desulfosarcina cetonica TaxID=90730 RepID=UPI0006D1F6FA|nr:NAD(P)/FAD-dependent oxidoreductase [Desulfosarcina cetonica]VTR70464.1 putative FAD binding domain protein [Desulfosarcina cetonica]